KLVPTLPHTQSNRVDRLPTHPRTHRNSAFHPTPHTTEIRRQIPFEHRRAHRVYPTPDVHTHGRRRNRPAQRQHAAYRCPLAQVHVRHRSHTVYPWQRRRGTQLCQRCRLHFLWWNPQPDRDPLTLQRCIHHDT